MVSVLDDSTDADVDSNSYMFITVCPSFHSSANSSPFFVHYFQCPRLLACLLACGN